MLRYYVLSYTIELTYRYLGLTQRQMRACQNRGCTADQDLGDHHLHLNRLLFTTARTNQSSPLRETSHSTGILIRKGSQNSFTFPKLQHLQEQVVSDKNVLIVSDGENKVIHLTMEPLYKHITCNFTSE